MDFVKKICHPNFFVFFSQFNFQHMISTSYKLTHLAHLVAKEPSGEGAQTVKSPGLAYFLPGLAYKMYLLYFPCLLRPISALAPDQPPALCACATPVAAAPSLNLLCSRNQLKPRRSSKVALWWALSWRPWGSPRHPWRSSACTMPSCSSPGTRA